MFKNIWKIYRDLKKACDLDQLTPNLLKDAANEIAPSLAYIINLSLITSTVPTDWKKAKVSLFYEYGSTTELENYRTISVLLTASKIMEREVQRKLFEFLDETKLLSKHQFGFQKKKSTELAAIVLLDQVRLAVDNGNLVGACFIDLQKAFDTISHNNLISKLERYDVKDRDLDWFKSFLFNWQIRVYQNGGLSEEKPVYTGVPQGSVLGPLLFVLFFNDISSHLKYSKIVKYADDTVIFCENSRLPTIER